MRNVTISLSDTVYRKARIAAAENDASLSAWVSGLVTGTVQDRVDFDRLKQNQNELLESIDSFDPSDRLTRDELHLR